MDKFDIEETQKFAVYAGSFARLDKLDLTFLNLKFSKISSKYFRNYLLNYNFGNNVNDNFEYFQKIKSDAYHAEFLYVLHPIEISEIIKEEIFWDIQSILLILFPSDFKLYRIVNAQLFDKKFLYFNYQIKYDFHDSGISLYDNFLFFKTKEVKKIDKFIKMYFERKPSFLYLKITISGYIQSFYRSHDYVAFINLFISLESIVNGKSELLYRIRRNCAIINSDNVEECKKIFEIVKKLYDLRSSIVHGEKFDSIQVGKDLPKLKSIVSSTIIELINFNINSVEKLNDKLTEIGFGDRRKLVKGYKSFRLGSKIDLL